MSSLDSSVISMHSTDFDMDTCSQIERDISQDPPTTPLKPEVNGNDDTTAATAAVMSPMPDISTKPIETSTRMARPTTKDTVSDPPPPPPPPQRTRCLIPPPPTPPPPPTTEPEVTYVDQFLEDLVVNPIQIHDLSDDFNDLGTIDLTNLANDDTSEPTMTSPRPLRALHVPIPRTRCKIPGKMTHPTPKTSPWQISLIPVIIRL